MTSRSIGSMLIAFSLLSLGAADTAPARTTLYTFDADVSRVRMALDYQGPAIIADLDPRYVVTLTNIKPVSGPLPELRDGTLSYAIHSPSQFFRGDPESGRYRFKVESGSTDSRWISIDWSASAGAPRTAAEPIHLFNGKDLTGWTWHSPTATSKMDDTWTVKDGTLHSAAKPTGYIQTEKSFDNFTLTAEYRHLTNANGGIFVCINGGIGNGKTWPDSLQIQGKFGNVGDLINQNTGMKAMNSDPARTKTINKDVVVSRMAGAQEKPLKEWNTLVIKVDHGSLTVTLNGQVVNTAEGLEPASGPIGIQAEGAEMEFRKLDLVPLE